MPLPTEHKPYQQKVAHSLGFNIPDTLITSSSQAVDTFRKKHKTIVVKSLSSLPPTTIDSCIFPTVIVAQHEPLDLTGLHIAPAIFQQAVEPYAEVRATVVGNKVFAAIVRDKNPKLGFIRDWRAGQIVETGLYFEPYTLSKRMQDQCIGLVRKMGLQYGAIDLIADPTGKFWFLEINPNGQWAFVESETGQPIGKAMAQLLEGKLPA
jgi:glutathione synthase/RimK-type ligase-like ATP-grasp enzyme